MDEEKNGKPEKAESKTAGKTPEEFTIEELAAKHQVKPWIMAGLKTAYGWGIGKRLTEKEFLTKKEIWLKGPPCRS